MKIILAISRSGNLSSAAKVLKLNQSTVSRRLSSFENDIGVTLFVREKKFLQPTEQGQVLITQSEQMESALLDGLGQLGNIESETTGSIRIVTNPWICRSILAPNIHLFQHRFPGIEVQIVADLRERFVDIAETEIALRFEMKPKGRIKNIPFVNVPFSIYAAADKAPEELPWVGFKEEYLQVIPEKWIRSAANISDIKFWANDGTIIHEIIRSGACKGLLAEHLGELDPDLQCVSKNKPELVRTLHIQVLDEVAQLKRVSVFLEWLSEIMILKFGTKNIVNTANK